MEIGLFQKWDFDSFVRAGGRIECGAVGRGGSQGDGLRFGGGGTASGGQSGVVTASL